MRINYIKSIVLLICNMVYLVYQFYVIVNGEYIKYIGGGSNLVLRWQEVIINFYFKLVSQ